MNTLLKRHDNGRLLPFRLSCSLVLVFSVFFRSSQVFAQAEEDRESAHKLIWRRAVGGSLNSYASEGPSGDVYVVADDRALHSIDPLTGESHWIYRPGGRLRSAILIGPDGTIYLQNVRNELFAVTPGGTGRWKLNMRRQGAGLPAVTTDGRLIVPLSGGRLLCVSRHGHILWSMDYEAEVSAGPVVSGDGSLWLPLSDGRVLRVDPWGRTRAVLQLPRAPSVLAIDTSGRLWTGGFDGSLCLFAAQDGGGGGYEEQWERIFQLQVSFSRTESILPDVYDGAALVFMADGQVLEVGLDGRLISSISLPQGRGAPSLSVDGTLYRPAADGSVEVFPDLDMQKVPGRLDADTSLSEPLLSREGVLISGGADWILYAWQAAAPAAGWSQFRGGVDRSGSRASPLVMDRTRAREDPGFFFRERMARSDDLADRLKLLGEMESYRDGWSLRREMPWLNLLLEDLTAVGTSRHVERSSESRRSHALARSRAYTLLAGQDDIRVRPLLLKSLSAEKDSLALGAGFRALGYLGSDWDGASTRLIAARYLLLNANRIDERLTTETAQALADLFRYNGGITDPAGYELLNSLVTESLTPSGSERILEILQPLFAQGK